jgi:glutathione-regulated potassium-efflux system ancillary protein KefC
LLRLAVSDYIDRIVDGRGLRQRVITQPRPEADIRPGRPLLYGGFICKDGLPVLGRVERRLAANMMPPAVVALGLIFAPFTMKTLTFLGVGVVVFIILPWLTPRFFRLYGGRPSELETKFLLLCLLGMGALATWADSEAVLPAYLIGMVLAGTVGKDHALVRRLRTLTFGLLTPFYFIRAGSFVSVPALVAAPAAFIIFLVVKITAKIVGVYPVTKFFGSPNKEAMYTTLLMSTGLTFGTISSLFGLSHGIINQGQYSALVAAVIASAVIPTVIANAFYLPRHLLPEADPEQASDRRREVTQLRPVTRKAE